MLCLAVARQRPGSTLFPYTTLFRSEVVGAVIERGAGGHAGDLDRERGIGIDLGERRSEEHTDERQPLTGVGGGVLNAHRAAVEVEGRRVGDRGDVEVDRA